jgi:hypothetical protein
VGRSWKREAAYTAALSVCFLGGLWLTVTQSVDYIVLMLVGLILVSVRGGMELQKRLAQRR